MLPWASTVMLDHDLAVGEKGFLSSDARVLLLGAVAVAYPVDPLMLATC